MIVGSIVSISALVSSRSLATSLPSTVPLLYASVLVPSLIMLVVLTLPSIASPKSNIRAVTGVQA
jgi:hypothetical protein